MHAIAHGGRGGTDTIRALPAELHPHLCPPLLPPSLLVRVSLCDHLHPPVFVANLSVPVFLAASRFTLPVFFNFIPESRTSLSITLVSFCPAQSIRLSLNPSVCLSVHRLSLSPPFVSVHHLSQSICQCQTILVLTICPFVCPPVC